MSASTRLMGATAWQAECECAALNAAALLRLADRRATHSAVLEVLRTAPRSSDERASVEDTAFMRCAQAAIDLAASYESDLRDAVFAYFQELAAMRPRRRAMLEASIAGALVGLGMGG